MRMVEPFLKVASLDSSKYHSNDSSVVLCQKMALLITYFTDNLGEDLVK